MVKIIKGQNVLQFFTQMIYHFWTIALGLVFYIDFRTSMPDKNIPIDVESLSTFDIVW